MARHGNMQCPRCSSGVLVVKKAKGVGGQLILIDRCQTCEGIWFDGDELARAFSAAETNLQPPADAKATAMACPRCAHRLVVFRYPGTYVEIDMCRGCQGIWLDRDELKEIRTVRKHHAAKAASQDRVRQMTASSRPAAGDSTSRGSWLDADGGLDPIDAISELIGSLL